MKYKFWNKWENKTDLEKFGIKTLNLSIRLILENIPEDEIISIYVKGSFVRREMTRKSDVDVVTVLKTAKYISEIKKLDKWGEGSGLKPYPQFLGYSLWELRTGKRLKGKFDGGSSSRMVKHLGEYELIYGEDLIKRIFFMKSHEDDLEGMVRAFSNWFIPDYENEKFSFGMLVKQTFWLVENEQRYLGRNPPHAWKKLRDSIGNRRHIVYDAWELRENPNKDKKIRDRYVAKLKKYVEGLK